MTLFFKMKKRMILVLIGSFISSCTSMNPYKKQLSDKTIPLKQNITVGNVRHHPIYMGGLSYLNFVGTDGSGCQNFISGTDRGPNGQSFKFLTNQGGQQVTVEGREFGVPDFVPRLLKLKACGDNFEVVDQILLKKQNGQFLTGLPPRDGVRDGAPFGPKGEKLEFDLNGVDLESLAVDSKGHYWIGEEYLPALLEFDQKGYLIRRIAPLESLSKEQSLSSNTELLLPVELNHRMMNRGLEAIAIKGEDLYFTTQSPLIFEAHGKSESNVLRIYTFNLTKNKVTHQYLYKMESKINKIGDFAFSPKGVLHLVEQNGIEGNEGFRKIYSLDFSNSTDLQLENRVIEGQTIERRVKQFELMTEKELKDSKMEFVAKKEILDLKKVGFNFEKIEGFTFIDENHIAVVNDNDFGVGNQFGDLPANTFLGIFSFSYH